MSAAELFRRKNARLIKAGDALIEAMDVIAMRYHESGEICWCPRDACFVQGQTLADCRVANDAIKQWKEASK